MATFTTSILPLKPFGGFGFNSGLNQLPSFAGGSNNTSTSSSSSNLESSFSADSLPNVFSKLGEISEQKAQNDQRRFREDLPFQADVYQNFDATADARREGIDIRARQQNSNLTQDRMRLQSQLNMGEEQNRGRVQSQVKDSDLKRALSILPRK